MECSSEPVKMCIPVSLSLPSYRAKLLTAIYLRPHFRRIHLHLRLQLSNCVIANAIGNELENWNE